MKILLAPLNWGLGHATRCIPIVHHYLSQGDEVVLAGDGDSISLLRQRFPELRVIDLPSLELRYSADPQQKGFYLRAVWALVRFTIADHYYLRKALAVEHFDLIISDNRFGFYARDVRSIYITHQLYPILPSRLSMLQPLARALHARIYKRYDEVWVPDYANSVANLSGRLSHGGSCDQQVRYIGPISRFMNVSTDALPKTNRTVEGYSAVAVLSGLEPQRSMFEEDVLKRFANTEQTLLLVQGKVGVPRTKICRGNITIVPNIGDDELVEVFRHVDTIIARSGYSTIMDLDALGVLHKAELYPTPGQSEQEYLAKIYKLLHMSKKNSTFATY